jgi:MYXO-CTERM domain-containing protein
MITAAIAHVEIQLATELSESLALTRLSAYVKGALITQLAPNRSSDRVVMNVYAGCVVHDRGASGYLAPGKHQLELHADVTGQPDTLTAILADIQLDCPQSAATGGNGATIGARGTGSGCTVGAPGHAGGLALTLAGLLLAFVWRRADR